MLYTLIVVLFVSSFAGANRRITFVNRCNYPIWINPLTSENGAPLAEGIKYFPANTQSSYNIPSSGWAGRFWPKTGCNSEGVSCAVGQSIPPCPTGGCQPPAETKIEFFYPPINDNRDLWYDISLVDGYSLPVKITPSRRTSSCVPTNCRVSLNDCPTNEATLETYA